MQTLKKLIPSLLPLIGALATAFSPALQKDVASFGTAHPAILSAIVAVGGFIYHLLPSPAAK